jgi:hypothetical protein
VAESIIGKRDNDQTPITWGQVYALEKSLVEMQTPEELRARAWSIEARYRDAVGDTRAYDSFLKSTGVDLKSEPDSACAPESKACSANFIASTQFPPVAKTCGVVCPNESASA